MTENGWTAEIARLNSLLEQRTKERDEWKSVATAQAQLHADDTAKLQSDLADARRLYEDLIMCVVNKYPGESRHDTAKRYILDREKFSIGETKQAIKAAGKEADNDR